MSRFSSRIFRATNHRLPRKAKAASSRVFHGVPATKGSVFNLPTGSHLLYQKNIERSARMTQMFLTKFDKLSYTNWVTYFGMPEEQLKDV
jgi:hypothetical protein